MNSFVLSLKIGFGRFLMFVFTFLFAGYSLSSGASKEAEEASENFVPTVRFAVCSDIHLGEGQEKNEEKFKKLFDVAYGEGKSSEYKKLDAVIVVGDMTDEGKKSEYEIFMNIVKEKMKDETVLLSCMGNHEFIEYRDTDISKGYEVYKECVKEKLDTHEVLGGYHVIGVSYDCDSESLKIKKEWLKEQLDLAVADTGDKPIFVFQHPHPALTVYGSINWADLEVRRLLGKYSQVIDFSGHSHYNAADPRTIWQGSFTAVGTGAVTGLMGNLNYTSGDQYGYGESGSFWLVEADKEGNVRLRLYDLVSDRFFENDYYLTKENFKAYSWGNQKKLDTAPEFKEGTKIKVETLESGEKAITFEKAEGYYPAESYKIIIKDEKGKIVFSNVVLSGYTRADYEKETVVLGEIEKGSYKAKIKAYSPYSKGGKTLSLSFSVE